MLDLLSSRLANKDLISCLVDLHYSPSVISRQPSTVITHHFTHNSCISRQFEYLFFCLLFFTHHISVGSTWWILSEDNSASKVDYECLLLAITRPLLKKKYSYKFNFFLKKLLQLLLN
ncbi:hypothetical protein O6H91_15G018700 [Diphasiastrum complanatum]|uniref:Uncharacterized protein n=1 Tax=Diphasiastrum complanatum TaxID=34168 RepID=A0ACC2BG77_DIPCM|nr:hypothetical protein O6H91_15G018700 [Diphasiastrum complanatum]